ncbi:MFS transporter [Sneathiella sp.]|jgi:PPP family 3-phenylpropionic acid transporter|uniref:MFS transporter n=1 Tax=Sneathiella sp. TaxID=1964365 RepID=UPI0039E37496
MTSVPYSSKSAELRLTGYYSAFFAVYGIAIPLWPRWLEGQVSLENVGLVLGLSYWLKLVVVPVTSWVADTTGDRRRVMIALALIVFIGLLILPHMNGWVSYLVIWGIAGAALSTGIPLSDGLTMRLVQLLDLEFGTVRRWGSVSFMAVSLGVGALADWGGLDAIYYSILAASVLLLIAAYFTPRIYTKPDQGKAPFFKPLSLPNFPLFVVTVALLLSTHAALYGFSAIYWKSLGYSNTVITILWIVGVIAEIIMFSVSGRLIKRFGAMLMIIVAGLGGVVRWTLLAYATDLPVLVFAQLLHALTFALLYMSLIAYMTKRIPPAISASAQGLYDSLSMGVFFGILTMLAGYLFEIDPQYSFLLMTGCALLGVGLAVILLVRVRSYEKGLEQDERP